MPQNHNLDKRKPLADFTRGRLLPAPRTAAPNRRETFYPVACANPACNNVRWLTRNNAEKAEAEQRMCRKCQTTLAGKRGFAVTRALYGPETALRWVQQSQIAHPSRYELLVQTWLSAMDAIYQAQ